MRLATLRRSKPQAPLPGLHGVVRVASAGEPTADLAARVRTGDLAVLSCQDLDAGSARQLVQAGAAGVVNAALSISGRYPALGAEVLTGAGVALLDAAGPEVLRRLADGARVRLDGEHLYRGDEIVASGTVLTADRVQSAMDRARAGLALQLEAFAGSTAEHLRRERDLFLDGEGIPHVDTAMTGRPVLVVSAGPGWQADLARLSSWLKEAEPVVIGVDEGLDAAREAGLAPTLFVGNPERVSERALVSGVEVVVRCDRDGSPAGFERADALGARMHLFPVSATAEDAALLLADAARPAYIVLAGSRTTVADFVDRTRPDMAGTFLARLKVGSRVVDGTTLASIYRPGPRTWPMWLLALALLAAVVAVVVVAGDATVIGEWRESALTWVEDLWQELT